MMTAMPATYTERTAVCNTSRLRGGNILSNGVDHECIEGVVLMHIVAGLLRDGLAAASAQLCDQGHSPTTTRQVLRFCHGAQKNNVHYQIHIASRMFGS
jgi:hypothetical protein